MAQGVVLRVHQTDSTYSALLREIIIWKQLRHPNIQPFLGVDVDVYPSRLAVISRWEANGTIKSVMRTFQPQILDNLRLDWIVDIAQGLEYLHDNHIVHGDVRCDNILITDKHHARLTDFGLTTLSNSTTRTMGAVAGVLPYAWAAPELVNGLKRLSFACDVYSFACTCVEICTGKMPFDGLTNLQIVRQLVIGKRPSISTGDKSRSMTQKLRDLVDRCWSEDPSQRPVMGEVVKKLVSHT